MAPGPETARAWADASSVALLTDLYELTMAQAYLAEGMAGPAVFSLLARRLPKGRNYLVAAGLEDALRTLESLRFEKAALEWLASLRLFDDRLFAWLAGFRFSGVLNKSNKFLWVHERFAGKYYLQQCHSERVTLRADQRVSPRGGRDSSLRSE